MGVFDNLSQHQFGAQFQTPEPVTQMPAIASSEDQVDLSWADRGLDPVLATNQAPVAPVRSPAQTLSAMNPMGYAPENFRT